MNNQASQIKPSLFCCLPDWILFYGVVLFYFFSNIYSVHQLAHATTFCAGYATARSQEFHVGAEWNEPTRNIVTFYSALLAAGKLDEADLLKMRDELVRGELVNPFPRIGRAATENSLFAKEVARLFTRQVNTAHVLLWVESEMRARGTERVRREERQTATKNPFRKIKWVRVEPSEFGGGESRSNSSRNLRLTNVKTKLNNAFLVTDTHLTQSQWIEVMGENPSENQKGFGSAEIQFVDPNTGVKRYVQGQPDYPVESATWYSIAEFLNRINLRDGFQPVYDFSELSQRPNTRAENGTLDFDGGHIKINVPDGNIYKFNGYRFLTEGEILAMYQKAGVEEMTSAELLEHGWFSENSDTTPSAVATKVPFIVDGRPVFDLVGNVGSLLFDGTEAGASANGSEYKGGVDPQTWSGDAWNHVVRGGHWITKVDHLFLFDDRYGARPSARSPRLGVRIARTVK